MTEMKFRYKKFTVWLDINEHERTLIAKIRAEGEDEITIIEANTVNSLEQGIYFIVGNSQQLMGMDMPLSREMFTTLTIMDYFQHEEFRNIGEGLIVESVNRLMQDFIRVIDIGRMIDHHRAIEYRMQGGLRDSLWGVQLSENQHALKRKEHGRAGGVKRTTEQQKNYEIHKLWWGEWQKNPSLYANATAYDAAMQDKTGASNKTIREHRKGFSATGSK